MNFIDRLKAGWRLMLGSFAVIGRNKTLLLFPIATAVLTLVMAALFLGPILYGTGLQGLPQAAPIIAVLVYFLSMFLATFFNVAFMHEIFDALDGRPVSVGEGLAFASSKIKPILVWSLFAGVIGWAIRALEERFGLFGRWIIGLIGLAWSVAATFAIPVLVMEPATENPVDVVRRSAEIIKKSWGEAIGGYAGLQIGGLLVALSGFVVVPAALYLGFGLSQFPLMIACLGGWVLAAIAFTYVLGVAGHVYVAVLYRFATTGVVPEGFTPEMLALAWKPKKA